MSLQLNKDLEGEIEMLTQTGPFSIPVVCTTRKCIVRATEVGRKGDEGGGGGGGECVEVDFGKVCVGEREQRSVILHNDGALPTDFTVTSSKLSGSKVSSTSPILLYIAFSLHIFEA